MAKVKVIPKRTALQKFALEEIERGQITNAPYNPRRITAEARRRLKAKIEDVGLVNAFVWNRRTGNLVGGHQRLSILDELEGRNDYRLTVAAVDVDERTEKELNVFLNNASSMGEWDLQALGKLMEEFRPEELPEFGFEAGELDFLTDAKGGEGEPEPGGEGGDPTPKETQDGTQVVVVFRDAGETDAFLRLLGASLDSRYVDGLRHFGRRGFGGGKESV
ncbi:hypothetical protein OpiT1DRAFT_01289 [Opitutaceae bacterium TAV1]|nr:hypothetical protein OpiT1DRAFT_01289 [Opitutaceae bacterium TAV1]